MKNQGVFDPTALERAAQALRELNQSPHAAKALEAMIKTEEAKRADKQAIQKQNEIQKVKVEGEERRRNMDHQKQVNQQIADYNDKLERERTKDKLKDKELTAQKMREETEESIKRQENMRRETLTMQMKKQFELEEKKISLQAKLNAENYRKNFDLIIQEQEKKAQIEKQAKIELHNLYFVKFQEGFKYLQQNPQGLFTIAKVMLFVSGAFFFSKYSLGLGFKRLEAILTKPTLVRETSRRSLKWMMPSSKRIFDKIILNPELEVTLKLITSGFIAKQSQSAPLRNLLFHGQPGTGKTLFAKLLAYNSGLHFAIISGGDIEKLGEQAVPEIDKLFSWCQSTPKGTLIFIDEAEAIFYKRSSSKQTSAALSTFLAQTSAASKKYSLILATNLPNKLDEAILDRIDQIVKFDYLNEEQRVKLLKKGFEDTFQKSNMLSLLLNPAKAFQKRFKVNFNLSDDEILQLAKQMEDFSPRQIDKFIISLYDAALGQCIIDKQNQYCVDIDFANNILQRSLYENQLRQQWSAQI
ncbi:unnamed protein product [Paramecium pentaurelia]|uniref:AAA+ ATPase domain-containing protein n=1 Tax=Paramecium pentaurelia TaxID=43138 RepID=A0A8S1T7Z5_9CILI|nr:unnamed protein product [Paramecium pentaurelia]